MPTLLSKGSSRGLNGQGLDSRKMQGGVLRRVSTKSLINQTINRLQNRLIPSSRCSTNAHNSASNSGTNLLQKESASQRLPDSAPGTPAKIAPASHRPHSAGQVPRFSNASVKDPKPMDHHLESVGNSHFGTQPVDTPVVSENDNNNNNNDVINNNNNNTVNNKTTPHTCEGNRTLPIIRDASSSSSSSSLLSLSSSSTVSPSSEQSPSYYDCSGNTKTLGTVKLESDVDSLILLREIEASIRRYREKQISKNSTSEDPDSGSKCSSPSMAPIQSFNADDADIVQVDLNGFTLFVHGHNNDGDGGTFIDAISALLRTARTELDDVKLINYDEYSTGKSPSAAEFFLSAPSEVKCPFSLSTNMNRQAVVQLRNGSVHIGAFAPSPITSDAAVAAAETFARPSLSSTSPSAAAATTKVLSPLKGAKSTVGSKPSPSFGLPLLNIPRHVHLSLSEVSLTVDVPARAPAGGGRRRDPIPSPAIAVQGHMSMDKCRVSSQPGIDAVSGIGGHSEGISEEFNSRALIEVQTEGRLSADYSSISSANRPAVTVTGQNAIATLRVCTILAKYDDVVQDAAGFFMRVQRRRGAEDGAAAAAAVHATYGAYVTMTGCRATAVSPRYMNVVTCALPYNDNDVNEKNADGKKEEGVKGRSEGGSSSSSREDEVGSVSPLASPAADSSSSSSSLAAHLSQAAANVDDVLPNDKSSHSVDLESSASSAPVLMAEGCVFEYRHPDLDPNRTRSRSLGPSSGSNGNSAGSAHPHSITSSSSSSPPPSSSPLSLSSSSLSPSSTTLSVSSSPPLSPENTAVSSSHLLSKSPSQSPFFSQSPSQPLSVQPAHAQTQAAPAAQSVGGTTNSATTNKIRISSYKQLAGRMHAATANALVFLYDTHLPAVTYTPSRQMDVLPTATRVSQPTKSASLAPSKESGQDSDGIMNDSSDTTRASGTRSTAMSKGSETSETKEKKKPMFAPLAQSFPRGTAVVLRGCILLGNGMPHAMEQFSGCGSYLDECDFWDFSIADLHFDSGSGSEIHRCTFARNGLRAIEGWDVQVESPRYGVYGTMLFKYNILGGGRIRIHSCHIDHAAVAEAGAGVVRMPEEVAVRITGSSFDFRHVLQPRVY